MSTRSSQEGSVRNCVSDEGRPLGIGLQEQVPNHPSAAVAQSHGRERGREKARHRLGQVSGKKRTATEGLANWMFRMSPVLPRRVALEGDNPKL